VDHLTILNGVLLAPERAGELEVHCTTAAAVLVPLYIRDRRVHAVFTERRHDLPRHAGEISFPGGRRDPEDATLLITALREAQEEIGLNPDAVEILGALQPTPTIATGYAIYPFVGLISPDQTWAPSEREVAAVIELSLSDVAAGYARRRLTRRGVAIRTDTYAVDGHVIWGATARIVEDLLFRFELADRVGERALR
jgi:8-oxo-dGTP pyrophosphatase MutT (NUDIX family)